MRAHSSIDDRLLGTTEAARRLGVTTETIRRWVKDHELDGLWEERPQRDRYFVSEAAVEMRERGRADALRADPGEQERRVVRLEEQVRALSEHDDQGDRGRLQDERDRYRAENAALKEVALRMNAAAEHLSSAVESYRRATEEQGAALTQLLTPHSPSDLS